MVVRQTFYSVQCILFQNAETGVSKDMVRFGTGISRESVVDVYGTLSVPREPVESTTQRLVEIQVEKVFVVSRAENTLPFQVEDAARSEEKAHEENLATVLQDTRLDFRWIDLRTPANQAIFRYLFIRKRQIILFV